MADVGDSDSDANPFEFDENPPDPLPKPKPKTKAKKKGRPPANRRPTMLAIDLDFFEIEEASPIPEATQSPKPLTPIPELTKSPKPVPPIPTFRVTPVDPAERLSESLLGYLTLAARTVSSAFLSELSMQLEESDQIRSCTARFLSELQREIQKTISTSVPESDLSISIPNSLTDFIALERSFPREVPVPVTDDVIGLVAELETGKSAFFATWPKFKATQCRSDDSEDREPEATSKLSERLTLCEICQVLLESQPEFIERQMARLDKQRNGLNERRHSLFASEKQDEISISEELESCIAELKLRRLGSTTDQIGQFSLAVKCKFSEMHELFFELGHRFHRIAQCAHQIERKENTENEYDPQWKRRPDTRGLQQRLETIKSRARKPSGFGGRTYGGG
jgi:hypothetical protein